MHSSPINQGCTTESGQLPLFVGHHASSSSRSSPLFGDLAVFILKLFLCVEEAFTIALCTLFGHTAKVIVVLELTTAFA